MYCIKCGVELADSEKACPLCGTVVFHPDLPQPEGKPLYPTEGAHKATASRVGWMFVLSMLFVLALAVCLWTDWGVNGRLIWSDYVIAGVMLFYVIFFLPRWFPKPNPVIFMPIDFAATILFLLYINCATGGHWFLSFAFPVAGGIGVILSAATALMYYLKRGRLFVIGGTVMALGAFCILLEFLLNITFLPDASLFWSFYPAVSGGVIGFAAMIVAANRPMREWLHKKLFF